MNEMEPKVGVGVLVFDEKGRLLLGQRKSAHGSGTWGAAGGHLEFGEDPFTCAARELEEETGLMALSMEAGPWQNDFFEEEGKHYVTLFILVHDFEGVLELKEPEKCERWQWFEMDELPSPLFLPLVTLFQTKDAVGGVT